MFDQREMIMGTFHNFSFQIDFRGRIMLILAPASIRLPLPNIQSAVIGQVAHA